MGNVLTVEAAAPTVVLAAAIISITVALQWVYWPSQRNAATGNASMTNNQLTYSRLNHSVINTTNNNYVIGTVPQLPSDTRGTTSQLPFVSLPPQVQETTSQLPFVSGTTTQAHIPVNVTQEKTSQQLPSAPSKPQSPPLSLPPPETTPPQTTPTQTTPPQVVKGMYWYTNSGFAVENIDANLYTHILCASAELDPNTNMVTIPYGNAHEFSTFTSTLQRKNPSISTLLSIGGTSTEPVYFSVMASDYASRQIFITSSIQLARINNFFGLEISWAYPEGTADMANYGTLLTELRVAVNNEAFATGRAPLLLTASLYFSAIRKQDTHPVYSINTNLDWINVRSYGYYVPSSQTEFTCAPAALYSHTETGIDSWIRMGLSPKKIAIWLPFYGFAWQLVDSNYNGIGAVADGPAVGNGIVHKGFISYKDIIKFIEQNEAITNFDSSVVTNYCYAGTTWIGYDGVESVRAKVLFAKNRGLLGYHAWSVGDEDDNFVLSRTAYDAWE